MFLRKGLLPFLIFMLICLFFLFGLKKNPSDLPSALINHKVPDFVLEDLSGNKVTNEIFSGKVSVINFWASWCYACLKEHDELFKFSKKSNILFVGVDYKDTNEAANKWLNLLKNPYKAVIIDSRGSLGLDLGVYGVPETFVVDRDNVIRMRISGPLTEQVINEKIEPLLKTLSL